MIYEQRIYTVSPGRMPELIERFEKHTIRLFKKFNIKPIVFGISKDDENKFFYVLEFKDLEQRQDSWKDFMEDEERIKIWDKSNESGKLVINIESVLYDSLSF